MSAHFDLARQTRSRFMARGDAGWMRGSRRLTLFRQHLFVLRSRHLLLVVLNQNFPHQIRQCSSIRSCLIFEVCDER